MTKTNQHLKVLVETDYSKFIVAKKYSNYITLISPFYKNNDKYVSNFILPSNRMQRAQSFYSLIPDVCELNVSGGEIHIDCISKIFDNNPEAVFQNEEEGMILFDYELKKAQETDEDQIMITPRCVIASHIIDEDTFEVADIKFRTDRLKVFPIILSNGFILSIIDPNNNITTYTMVEDARTGFVGSCENKETSEVFNYLLPLWGGNLFTINISNKIGRVFIDPNVCQSFEDGDDTIPSFVKMKRNITDNTATIQKIAHKINIAY